jgi:hypothetical protein
VRRGAAVVLALVANGCGLQVGSGPAWPARGHVQQTWSASATLQAERASNGIVGARLVSVADNGLAIRSGAVHAGWDFVLVRGWLYAEPGLDLGAGSPVHRVYSGIGAYGGLSGVLRFRPLPNPSRDPAFSIFHVALPEIIVAPHAGWFMPPEQDRSNGFDFQGGFEVALRVALGSDFASGPQGSSNPDVESPATTTTNGGKQAARRW